METNEKQNPVDEEICLQDSTKIDKVKKRNRRYMAWISLFTIILIIVLFFFAPISDNRLKIIVDSVSMICWVLGGVIGTYMGFSTYERFKMK
jgi:exosortase/archaeosortase